MNLRIKKSCGLWVHSGEGGFTIPELLIVMAVTLILSSLVFDFAINFWSSSATLQNDSATLATRLNTGDVMREALDASSGLIDQNSIPDANAANPDPTAGPTYWLLIHAIPSSIPVGASGTTTPVMYWRAPSIDTSKNFIMNGVQPYQDEFVLYLNGTTKQLLLRSLANPAATRNGLKTSCPTVQASSMCPADRVVATDVSSVDTRYFSRSGNTIDYTSIVDPNTGAYMGPDFPAVEVVELTVHLYHKSTVHNGADTSNEVIIRVALRNN